MKTTLAALLRWFSIPAEQGDGPEAGLAHDTRSPERRLRSMQESGRTLFLP